MLFMASTDTEMPFSSQTCLYKKLCEVLLLLSGKCWGIKHCNRRLAWVNKSPFSDSKDCKEKVLEIAAARKSNLGLFFLSNTLITFNNTPSKCFLSVLMRTELITLLLTLYLTFAYRQPVSQHHSLLQQLMLAVTLGWWPVHACQVPPAQCCLRLQTWARGEHQLIHRSLFSHDALHGWPWPCFVLIGTSLFLQDPPARGFVVITEAAVPMLQQS